MGNKNIEVCKIGKYTKVCEISRRLRKNVQKRFFCKFEQRHINQLGIISSRINTFPSFLGKYASYEQKFAKFAKFRDVCKKRAKTFFCKLMQKYIKKHSPIMN